MPAKNLNNIWLLLLKDGIVAIEMFPDLAPQAVGRIQTLTRSNFYDGLTFHRVIPGFVAQGGDPNGNGSGGSTLPNLPLEPSNLSHTRGTVAFARATDPNSANSQFYIVLENSTFLDRQYTSFGTVITGMSRVDNIKAGTQANNGTVAAPADRIQQAEIAADITPVTGTAGNDSRALGATDIIVDFGAGRDTLDIAGNRGAFTLDFSRTSGTVPTVTITGQLLFAESRNIERMTFDNGTLVLDTADPMYTVYGLYRAALNREPDAAGLRYFADLANKGARISDIARDLAGSPEFTGRYGALNNTDFVNQMYLNVLGRGADAGGAAYWNSVLAAGATRGEILRDFVTSAENTAIIANLVGVGVFIPDFQVV